jgi:predicted alpha/beta superfamily hydrolase
MITRLILMILIFGDNYLVQSQTIIKGNIVDASNNQPLAYVNVGINKKNIGTISRENGEFSIKIPDENLRDTLSFSLVGFQQLDLPVKMLSDKKSVNIKLRERTVELNELTIRENRPIEKKFGIKKRGGPIHFTDGMFSQEDIFEIGQLIKLGRGPAQIMSANLYISSDTEDSASFRINFYRYDGEKPSDRIIAKSILQKHPVKKGWLRFDVSDHGVVVDGDFIVSVECIPDAEKTDRKLTYEVKLGGSSKSFYRRNSLGQWNTPPHHYCLFITALVDKDTPDEIEDKETLPAFKLYSEVVKDTFNVFVRLPKDYQRSSATKYPVVYHLDGNAYFEHVSTSINKLSRRKAFKEPILVGIGYRDAYVMDSLRNRDYTFPKALASDSFAVSGGGQNFYKFLEHELIPQIEYKYKTDARNRTIMGHSLGGYFTLYALCQGLNKGLVFNNYVSASPSISYHHDYIVNELKRVLPRGGKNLKLFLSMGEMEISGNSFSNFNDALKTSRIIDIQTRVYPDLEHMGTAVPSFEDGMKFISIRKYQDQLKFE